MIKNERCEFISLDKVSIDKIFQTIFCFHYQGKMHRLFQFNFIQKSNKGDWRTIFQT